MKKKTTLSEEDQALFRQLMAGTRKIKQDTIVQALLIKSKVGWSLPNPPGGLS
ncbi:hypothetical protein QREC_QR620_02802 [Escherichia coli]|nr:hypothetical protein QREC_QR620_02802 [Escherichia coli]